MMMNKMYSCYVLQSQRIKTERKNKDFMGCLCTKKNWDLLEHGRILEDKEMLKCNFNTTE